MFSLIAGWRQRQFGTSLFRLCPRTVAPIALMYGRCDRGLANSAAVSGVYGERMGPSCIDGSKAPTFSCWNGDVRIASTNGQSRRGTSSKSRRPSRDPQPRRTHSRHRATEGNPRELARLRRSLAERLRRGGAPLHRARGDRREAIEATLARLRNSVSNRSSPAFAPLPPI